MHVGQEASQSEPWPVRRGEVMKAGARGTSGPQGGFRILFRCHGKDTHPSEERLSYFLMVQVGCLVGI